MPTGQPLTADEKGKIGALILAGGHPRDIAEAHGIAVSTAYRIGAEVLTEVLPNLPPDEQRDLSAAVEDYAHELIATLRALLAQFRRPEWLDRQTAADLARLFDIVNQQTLSLFRAVERARSAGFAIEAGSETSADAGVDGSGEPASDV